MKGRLIKNVLKGSPVGVFTSVINASVYFTSAKKMVFKKYYPLNVDIFALQKPTTFILGLTAQLGIRIRSSGETKSY